jgi:hypothetical protein
MYGVACVQCRCHIHSQCRSKECQPGIPHPAARGYDLQVGAVCMGGVAAMPDTGTPALTVYYAVHTGGRTVVKWANDQGYQGVVQVGAIV